MHAHAAPTGARTGTLGWLGLAIAAVLLPVDATAGWLKGAHTATPADLVAGVWILKISLVALAASALFVQRLPATVAQDPAVGNPDGGNTKLVLATILVVALGLRLFRLDTELWLDEIILRLRYAPLEFRQLISTYDNQNHQPLYSLLARLSFVAAGGTDWSIRVPAVVGGVASLAALWWFARRVTSQNEALLAVLVLAFSYHHVWFSQNARGYTVIMLLTLVTTGVFLRLCEGDGRRRLAWTYGILIALATYTHLTAAFVAVGHAVTLLLVTGWKTRDARQRAMWPAVAIGLGAVITVVLYAPMLPQVWRQVTVPTMEDVAIEWTGAGWMLREGARVLAQGIPGGLITVAAAVAVLLVGIASYWRQSRLTTLLMYMPVAITFVAIVAARHNLWPRFFFFAAGFFVLAALRGGFVLVRWVVRWRPERVAIAGATGVALLSLLTVPRAWQPKQQFRAAYDFIEAERRPGDEVVAIDDVFFVYLLRGWGSGWRHLTDLAMLSETERSAGRTWVVYTLPARVRALTPDLYQHLEAPRYQVVRVYPASVGGGEILILRHDPASEDD